ncbi:MAG: hypothetical protein HLUCCO17_16040 [Saliniramus fredricksonii]|uniref:Uncharacterized protein n=1 Tax=Saliniramus fredricksonii TaxID=1653334 RepID=A0A0P7XXH6_9HYPH|nr:hypothetical protein [Saliniramus fredricksonii]KPQ09190.1 MAG: hypothetical protein HLUCCO17_16040 [Saliniramus fredricksonii]SCC80798.1 hypothetical protein GA0071312_1726 [Saliniramus fredricksonii]
MSARPGTEGALIRLQGATLCGTLPPLLREPTRRSAHVMRCARDMAGRTECGAQHGLIRFGDFGRLNQYRHVVLDQPALTIPRLNNGFLFRRFQGTCNKP